MRTTAWERDRDDSDESFRRALGRQAEPIAQELKVLLKDLKGKDLIAASAVLLVLDPNHHQALSTLVAEMKAKESVRREEICQLIGEMRLSQAELIDALAEALSGRDATVCRAAAKAVSMLGRKTAKGVHGSERTLPRSGKP